jgi:hypothetical protein
VLVVGRSQEQVRRVIRSRVIRIVEKVEIGEVVVQVVDEELKLGLYDVKGQMV